MDLRQIFFQGLGRKHLFIAIDLHWKAMHSGFNRPLKMASKLPSLRFSEPSSFEWLKNKKKEEASSVVAVTYQHRTTPNIKLFNITFIQVWNHAIK